MGSRGGRASDVPMLESLESEIDDAGCNLSNKIEFNFFYDIENVRYQPIK